MKKLLPAAVCAALAGVNGAQAVHVNSDGKGQVLLYPYYTVENFQDTYINLVNTTDETKAVKIRILESMNSQEVLDFNLYMSPKDHWSAVITRDDAGGASLTSADTSCTVPLAVSAGQTIPFRRFEFTQDSVNGIERTREGYVEVIEMGVVTDASLQAAIEHNTSVGSPGFGVPADCAELDTQWSSGQWSQDADFGMTAPSGGLYGYGVLIDVPRGTDATYDAVAIDNWFDSLFAVSAHSEPGDLLPNLGEGSSDYNVFDQGGVVSGTADNGWDAVSAVLMQGSISNDYVLEPSLDAGTDWVVTFPTKRQYVNQGSDPLPPFTSVWNPETSSACETFDIFYWDREEYSPQTPPSENDFSPLPPPGEIQTFSFCHEANVLTFNNSNVLAASDRTGVNLNLESEPVAFNNGWADVSFLIDANPSAEGPRVLDAGGTLFGGLPAIGFAVQRYVNGDVLIDIDECDDDVCIEPPIATPTIRANYAGSVTHKGERLIAD